MASNRKAKKYLNWEPNYRGKSGFKIALKKTLEWYKNSENLKYFKSDFYNI